MLQMSVLLVNVFWNKYANSTEVKISILINALLMELLISLKCDTMAV